MSACKGTKPVGTKVDDSTRRFLEEESERLGVSRSEVLRRMIDVYRGSGDGDLSCGACGASLDLTGGVEA
jgi:hypothetical protein